MNTFAMIDASTRLVVNTIALDDPDLFEVPGGFIVIRTEVASIGWSYVDGVFSPPPEPPLSTAEIFAKNKSEQDALLSQASQAMAPVLVSLQLGDATDSETVTAREWQEYYRALKLVDISAQNPVWPTSPVGY